MFGSIALEVLIGIVTFFLLMSTACSAIADFCFWMLQQRAKLLQSTLSRLLTVLQAGAPQLVRPDPLLQRARSIDNRAPEYLDTGAFTTEVIARWMDEIKDAGGSRLGLRADAPPILQDMWKSAQFNLDQFKTAVGKSFDDAMASARDIFKRRAHVLLFIVGLVTAIMLNADTIMMVRALSTDPQARAHIVELSKSLKAPSQPSPGTTEAVDAAISQLWKIGLPLGWSSAPGAINALPVNPVGWLLKILGLVGTGLAVSFGGPFWYDMLSRVSNGKPAPTPDS